MSSDLIRGSAPVRVKESAPKKIQTFSPSTADLKSCAASGEFDQGLQIDKAVLGV